MKKRKQLICAMVILAMVLSFIPTLASADNSGIVLRYTGLIKAYSTLGITSDGIAECTGTTIVRSGYTSVVSMVLQKNDNGWRAIKTWETSGTPTANIQETYKVVAGYSYRLVVTATVYNSQGNYVEAASAYSSNVSY